jgi:hypothetical protein
MTYGAITTERWRRHKAETGEYLHVFVDGDEVTTECDYANDEEGVVRLLRRNADGKRYIDPDTHRAAFEWRTGRVEIVPEPNYPND